MAKGKEGGLIHKGLTTDWGEWEGGTGKSGWQGSGTSIFDPVLTEVCYSWFCLPGGKILDPFAGGSVRGIVAGLLGYNYTGLELRKEQVEANRIQLEDIGVPAENVKWITGDSNITLDDIEDESQDFLFTCPPYADLEVYSDLDEDISNMDYPDFLQVYQSIIEKATRKLKANRFAAVVIGDARDSNGFYYGLPEETVQAFKMAGIGKYNEIILVNAIGSLPIRAGRAFNSGRKVGKMHQNVLIFFKGDPKEIKSLFGEIDFREVENNLPTIIPEGVEEL